MQARVAELKESSAKNNASLVQYTWKEAVKIILNGEEKKTEHFQVRQGPDGKPIKTSLDASALAAAYDRMLKGDVRYRFVIDIDSLRQK